MSVLATTTEAANAMDWMPPVLMVVGVILLGLILTFSIRGKIERRNAARPSPRQRIEELKSAAHRQEDMQVATTDTLDLVQDLAARLNNRAERLQQLITQADERISQLGAATSQITAPAPQSTTIGDESVVDDGFAAPTGPGPTVDPLTRAIYELADAGSKPVEIARELDEQIGKVELILALRQG